MKKKRSLHLRIAEQKANLELAIQQERHVADIPPDRRKYIEATADAVDRLEAEAKLPEFMRTL